MVYYCQMILIKQIDVFNPKLSMPTSILDKGPYYAELACSSWKSKMGLSSIECANIIRWVYLAKFKITSSSKSLQKGLKSIVYPLYLEIVKNFGIRSLES